MPDSAIRIKNISKYFSLDKPQNESFTEGLVNLRKCFKKKRILGTKGHLLKY